MKHDHVRTAFLTATLPPAALRPPGARPIQVLVVEDDPVQALLLTLMLQYHGAEVTLATNGAQAFEAVQGGRPDLVLMDYRMPVVDGIEATRRIRHWELAQHLPATPIVAVTASVMAGECAAYRAAGMDDVIVKPISACALADVLGRHGAAREHGPSPHGAYT